MSLLQIGAFKILGQGHHGVFYERTGHRVNLTPTAAGGKGCAVGNAGCVDSYTEQYRLYIRGNGALSRAQLVERELMAEICPESGSSYWRRRETDDALLEIYKLRSGKLDHADFHLQYTKCRTIAIDATFEVEPLTPSEESDVISGDLTVTP